MWNLKKKKTANKTKTNLQILTTDWWLPGEGGWEEGKMGEEDQLSGDIWQLDLEW